MPEYTLRNVPPELWSRFTERANREGWPIKALIVNLLEAYANGRVTPQTPAPKQLPQWAWLRQHYKAIARADKFAELDANEQWSALIDHVLNSAAAMSWHSLDQVSPEQRGAILQWLRQTSDIESRHVLTLRAIASIGSGPDLQTNRRVFQYEVLGLPSRQQAWIADYDGGWRILRVVDGRQGQWGGPHLSKEDALDTLAQQLDQPDDTIKLQ